MRDLKWLTARPIAHRGLHDAATGVIENTASAFAAAIAGGYGIETDLQISSDGEAMVHHDFALGRLTLGSRLLAAMTAAGLKEVGDHGYVHGVEIWLEVHGAETQVPTTTAEIIGRGIPICPNIPATP